MLFLTVSKHTFYRCIDFHIYFITEELYYKHYENYFEDLYMIINDYLEDGYKVHCVHGLEKLGVLHNRPLIITG